MKSHPPLSPPPSPVYPPPLSLSLPVRTRTQTEATAVVMGLCPERGGTAPFVELCEESGFTVSQVPEEELHSAFRSERFFLLTLRRGVSS